MAEEKAGTESTAVPEALKSFVGADGKLDMQKVAQSMTEAQQKITESSQETLTAKRAYEELLATTGVTNPTPAKPTPDVKVAGRKPMSVDDLVVDPQAAIDARIDEKLALPARQVTEALLAMEHPELSKDEAGKYSKPEFVKGLLDYAKTLPQATRAAMLAGDYATANHVIRTYKALQRKATELTGQPNVDDSREKPNFSESGRTASVRKPGKIWTRSEIRAMAIHPEEYRKHEAEIDKAYEEDRVDFTK